MNVRFDIDWTQVETNLNVLISRTPERSKIALLAAGKMIYEDSQNLIPVDTETLKKTGHYEVTGSNRVWDLVVSYASPDKNLYNTKKKQWASQYAVVVHEDLEAHHNVGQAKFLERAVANWVVGLGYPRLANQLVRELWS